MKRTPIESYLGRTLAACWNELKEQGALSTWSPFWMKGPEDGVSVRFSNHWGKILGEETEYVVSVTDGSGVLRTCDSILLGELESVVISLDSVQGNDVVGAAYLGCTSPALRGLKKGRHADYFFMTYDHTDSMASVHSQPLGNPANGPTPDQPASWRNCVEIQAVDRVSVLAGNPSAATHTAPIQLRNLETDRRSDRMVTLPPFGVQRLQLDNLSPGWYELTCLVGRSYPHLLRARGPALAVRHL